MSSEEGYVLTANDVGWYDIVCKTSSWLAINQQDKLGIDVVQQIADILSKSKAANDSLAFDELAVAFGTTSERAQYYYTWLGGADYQMLPETFQPVLDTIPSMVGDPISNNGMVVGVYVFLTVLIIISVSLRVWARRSINGFLRAHDWILLVAALFTIAYGLLNSVSISTHSYHRLFCYRTWHDYVNELNASIGTYILYPITIFLIKTSLLLFYWGLTNWWPLRVATAVTEVVVFLNCVAILAWALARCVPMVSYTGYDFFETECRTNQYVLSEKITGSINIVTDVAIWMIPLPMVWQVTQNMRERFLSCFTFGLGALACVACGFRFSSVLEALSIVFLVPGDQAKYLTWTIVEMSLGVICSCAPAIRALLLKKAPSVLGTSVYTDETSKLDDKSEKLEKEKGANSSVNVRTPTEDPESP